MLRTTHSLHRPSSHGHTQGHDVSRSKELANLSLCTPHAPRCKSRPFSSPPSLQATPLSTHTVLKLSKELPIVVEYFIGDIGRLGFYLAPKIEEEEAGEMQE
jgi:hypothetical protein